MTCSSTRASPRSSSKTRPVTRWLVDSLPRPTTTTRQWLVVVDLATIDLPRPVTWGADADLYGPDGLADPVRLAAFMAAEAAAGSQTMAAFSWRQLSHSPSPSLRSPDTVAALT